MPRTRRPTSTALPASAPFASLTIAALPALVMLGGWFFHLPSLMTALLCVGAGAAVTGAMAEDAIGDSMDGLGGRAPERRLEILKDSRIGAYGVIGITLFIGLKASALAHLLDIRAAAVVPLFLAAEVVSRSAVALSHPHPAGSPQGRCVGDGRGATAGPLPCWPRLRGGYRRASGRALHQSGRGRVRLSFGLFHLPVVGGAVASPRRRSDRRSHRRIAGGA